MTDPASGRPPAPRRKRTHPAAASRVFVVGAAAAGTLAMTGLMVRPLDQTVSVEPTSADGAVPATLATGSEQATAPAARVVIIRRHHPAPSSGPVAVSSPTPTATASVSRAPAPPPRPAPRPAPVTSTSGGS